jgi:hypothetical protein
MFIYAAATALKEQGKSSFISSYEKLNYFNISVVEKIKNRLCWYFILALRKTGNAGLLKLKNGWTDYTISLQHHKGNTIITGYFQGIRYFGSVQDIIRKKFEIKKKYCRIYNDFAASFKNRKIVAVQIRRTDYLEFNDPELFGPDLSLPLNYYCNLMDQIRQEGDCIFIVMSDDKQYLHNHFNGFADVLISDNTEIVDLQVMMHADICIISPSSFGWWGAWLNHKPGKKVYVPENYLGFKAGKEYPAEIIPTGWIKVKVLDA